MSKKNIRLIILVASAIIMLILVIQFKPTKKDNSIQESATSTEKTNDTTANVNNTLKADSSKVIEKDTQSKIETLMVKYYDTSKEIDKDIIEGQTEKVTDQTVESITEKREGIESYKNVKTYVKPGLEPDTYVVYSTYDMKFFNIETLAPGMSVLYVAKDVNGTYAILDKPQDDSLNEYINEISKEDEIVKLIEDVNTRLAAAIKKDEALKTFVESLEKVVKTEKK